MLAHLWPVVNIPLTQAELDPKLKRFVPPTCTYILILIHRGVMLYGEKNDRRLTLTRSRPRPGLFACSKGD